MYLKRLEEIKNEYNLNDNIFLIAQKFIQVINQNDLIPTRITDLHEEGYAFKFIKNKNIEVWFEIYNDGDYGYIAFDKENNYKVIINEDILEFNYFIKFMKT